MIGLVSCTRRVSCMEAFEAADARNSETRLEQVLFQSSPGDCAALVQPIFNSVTRPWRSVGVVPGRIGTSEKKNKRKKIFDLAETLQRPGKVTDHSA